MKALSLRFRLLLWASVTSVFVLVLMIVLVDVTFRSNIREQLQESLSFARRVAEGARATQVDVRISATVNVAVDTRLRAAVATADPATISQTLDEVFLAELEGWAAVVATDGSLLASTPGAPVDELADAEQLTAQALYGFDTADLWLVDGQPVDVAASAILFGAEPLAVLVTGRRLDADQMTSLEVAVGRPVVLLFEDGALYGAEAEALPEEARAGLTEWSAETADAVELVRLGSEQFLAASLPLAATEGGRRATLVLLGSYDEALRPSNTLRGELIAILVFGLAISLAVGGVLARSITVPVGKLLEETGRLARGDLEHAIVPVREDEIGRLAESFDEMRRSLKVARADLIRAERLGAIGKAASAVAHDFTQPLSAIAGAIGLLKMESTPEEVREKCFTSIESQLERMQRMKQEIVEFARGESTLDEADVRVDSFLENTVSALRGQLAESGIELSITHGYGGEWYIDSYRLARVLENLVRNAAAAITAPGSIRIRSQVTPDDALVIEVEDSGSGIPRELLDEIFEPFVSHGKKEGTGLGLAIARNVVHQHEGTIEVRSSPDGACFTITLPRRRRPPAEAAKPEASAATTVGGRS